MDTNTTIIAIAAIWGTYAWVRLCDRLVPWLQNRARITYRTGKSGYRSAVVEVPVDRETSVSTTVELEDAPIHDKANLKNVIKRLRKRAAIVAAERALEKARA